MKYKIVITENAQNDIESVISLLYTQSGQMAVKKHMESFNKAYLNLSLFPEMFPMYRYKIPGTDNVRHFSFGKYICFYTVNKASCEVVLLRVLYGKSNIIESFK